MTPPANRQLRRPRHDGAQSFWGPAERLELRRAPEFQPDAVVLVLDGDRSIASVARDLGIGETNPGNWVRQARIDRDERPGLRATERAELVELRREVGRLRMERGLRSDCAVECVDTYIG